MTVRHVAHATVRSSAQMQKHALREFANALASSLGLPQLARIAAFALRRIVGEMEARSFSLGLWKHRHSAVVRHYRLQAVEDRVRWLCRFLAIQTVIWIAADYSVLGIKAGARIAVGRLIFAFCLLLLSRWRPSRGDVERNGSNMLGALVILLCTWQVFACYTLATYGGGVSATVMAAYFNEINILAVGVAIFPLTVLESLRVLATLMCVLIINVHIWPVRLEAMPVYDSILRLALFGSIGITASALQLVSFVQATEDSAHDRLTNLLNRKFGEEFLGDQLRTAMRRRSTCTLLYLDLDNFKSVNDTFGHEAGDRVLIALAQSLKRVLRSQDAGIRWGGEEFLVFLADTGLPDAIKVIERLALNGIGTKPDGTQMTASIGMVETGGDRGGKFERLVAQSDRLMYVAKSAGRNCYADGTRVRPFITLTT